MIQARGANPMKKYFSKFTYTFCKLYLFMKILNKANALDYKKE
jgi:hypothetical protein